MDFVKRDIRQEVAQAIVGDLKVAQHAIAAGDLEWAEFHVWVALGRILEREGVRPERIPIRAADGPEGGVTTIRVRKGSTVRIVED